MVTDFDGNPIYVGDFVETTTADFSVDSWKAKVVRFFNSEAVVIEIIDCPKYPDLVGNEFTYSSFVLRLIKPTSICPW